MTDSVQQLTGERLEAEKKVNDLRDENCKLSNDIEQLTDNVKQLTIEKAEAEKKVNDLRDGNCKFSNYIEQLRDNVKQLRIEKAEAEKKINDLRDENCKISNDNRMLHAQKVAHHEFLNALNELINTRTEKCHENLRKYEGIQRLTFSNICILLDESESLKKYKLHLSPAKVDFALINTGCKRPHTSPEELRKRQRRELSEIHDLGSKTTGNNYKMES